MADTKISAMSLATEAKNADVLPIVSAAANFRVAKDIFLTGAAGEPIWVHGASGEVVGMDQPATGGTVNFSAAGALSILGADDIAVQDITRSFGLTIDAAGGVELSAGATTALTLSAQGATTQIVINAAADTIFASAGNGFDADISGLTAASWDSGPPATFKEAIERLANWGASFGDPIP